MKFAYRSFDKVLIYLLTLHLRSSRENDSVLSFVERYGQFAT